MRTSLAVAAVTLLASTASAGSLGPDEGPGITDLERGVFELDVGALAVFAHESQGDVSSTQLSTAFSGSVSYFVKRNVSVALTGIFAYDSRGDDNTALTLGGTVGAAVHLRLGQGAFFRPGVAVGALLGNRELPVGAMTVEEASQTVFLTRLSLPLAYFIGRRVVLQAGPQLDVQLGSYEPTAGDAQSFTRLNGGFAIAAGYAF
jgi:hypothetical protein